ncbi:hypothetical protein J8273_6230 [Carpediemonas membranifera]|uniref:Uncharacterized protein n=1 Tax=Carpediemonas membranifera TaxID=201153 RepID=A0A8J6AU02_9EUKA|nr:hypothetical protein J8273_6230 [Carpediemonas membranifera]|eukprot:KAG9391470.1 hypothetical protein J8273_6230 [Carpediemonas membranifera]
MHQFISDSYDFACISMSPEIKIDGSIALTAICNVLGNDEYAVVVGTTNSFSSRPSLPAGAVIDSAKLSRVRIVTCETTAELHQFISHDLVLASPAPRVVAVLGLSEFIEAPDDQRKQYDLGNIIGILKAVVIQRHRYGSVIISLSDRDVSRYRVSNVLNRAGGLTVSVSWAGGGRIGVIVTRGTQPLLEGDCSLETGRRIRWLSIGPSMDVKG